MGSIFGKPAKSTQTSQSTSTSDSHSFNNYNAQAGKDFGSTAASTGKTNNALSALLGLGGDVEGQTAAFNNYKDSTGYQFGLDQGMGAITGGAASKGLLNSGATAKALTQYGQDYASTKFNDYLSQLFNLGGQGMQAGNILANTGQESKSHSQAQSTSSGTSKGAKSGLGGLLGSAASGIAASDRRLKKDIRYLRTMQNGLGVYQYNYINDAGPFIGVMADEVAKLVPEALGPVIDGYATVDYSKIGV